LSRLACAILVAMYLGQFHFLSFVVLSRLLDSISALPSMQWPPLYLNLLQLSHQRVPLSGATIFLVGFMCSIYMQTFHQRVPL